MVFLVFTALAYVDKHIIYYEVGDSEEVLSTM